MATDFRSGTDFPRRGREEFGGYLWLLRLIDKARAAAAGTIHDYIYPCPMDQGVMERWGITAADFDAAVRTHGSDDAIVQWLRARVDAAHGAAANRWLLEEKAANLDRQDAEEGAAASPEKSAR
ncbi:MAG: DUF5069 domain-containing protein [Candidatus Eremiobacteraeota bacterium]|nr:DUF5069 domain-containing protein [Candidatus Eremiobacteraeota bacterium]MBC5803104.1 DUF5069 domain-containing protein [Candidatus Eremiobacteraeota bacterium]MBC5820949.1 DUF5069 domain-containing protein [Candidatus Eremiobacteraeota bacterium]